jgi:hypothetical protein
MGAGATVSLNPINKSPSERFWAREQGASPTISAKINATGSAGKGIVGKECLQSLERKNTGSMKLYIMAESDSG